jgi:hypothetical protein
VRAGRVAQTNDVGEFRLFGLLPGKYYVSAAGPNGPSVPVQVPRETSPPPLRRPAPSETTGSTDQALDGPPGYVPTYHRAPRGWPIKKSRLFSIRVNVWNSRRMPGVTERG